MCLAIATPSVVVVLYVLYKWKKHERRNMYKWNCLGRDLNLQSLGF